MNIYNFKVDFTAVSSVLSAGTVPIFGRIIDQYKKFFIEIS